MSASSHSGQGKIRISSGGVPPSVLSLQLQAPAHAPHWPHLTSADMSPNGCHGPRAMTRPCGSPATTIFRFLFTPSPHTLENLYGPRPAYAGFPFLPES